MKIFLKPFIGVLFVFVLTGCIGEDYDFTPPSVTLFDISMTNDDIKLKEANIDWNTDKQYSKKTKDIRALAQKQQQIRVNPDKQEFYVGFDSQDFKILELNVLLWQKDKKTKLELDKNHNFQFPIELGDYLIEVDLLTDNGSAEYVGNIEIHD
ncbi:hypothetical protein CUU66_14005 [Peribacillus deserti]|uniref:Uncharacterized protein n=2 Tax=Peribacillus deserti TaxID=673318 RepID=A0A2N5M4M6_9BACI|nr:hypothetical protein CUU66_14005 [Peribacillus deserti]